MFGEGTCAAPPFAILTLTSQCCADTPGKLLFHTMISVELLMEDYHLDGE
eukprot:SAG31_NODE_29000_length_402_cov_0.973597_1_plen_49_part_10